MKTPASDGRGLQVARAVSVMLHPFVVFGVLALLGAWRLAPVALPRTALGIAVALVLLAAFIRQRRRGGHWQTVDASRREERPLLYALALVVAGAYWWWMGGSASPTSAGVLAVVVMLAIAGVANRWIKLSLHVASLAFAGVALLGLLPAAGVVALLLVTPLAWARLRMGRHRAGEVVGGGVLGLGAGVVMRVLS